MGDRVTPVSLWYNGLIMANLRDQSITLTGLELVRLLRVFVDIRCDDVGLRNPDHLHELIRAQGYEGNEEEYQAVCKEIGLRGDLRSLIACKEFALRVLDGEKLFTRQGEEPTL